MIKNDSVLDSCTHLILSRRKIMEIVFDTTGYMGRRNFKPETAARLFRKVWDWSENFDRMIANNSNIKIKSVTIQKEDDNPFVENLTIRIQGTAYRLIVDEKIYFSINGILYPKKPDRNFDEQITQKLIERLKTIEESFNKDTLSMNETLLALTSK